MKGTRKVLDNASTSENKLVQKKLDDANAALKKMDVSVFENKVIAKQKNER